jgi:hypothetical protein
MEYYRERVSQQPRERRKRDQEGKLQEVDLGLGADMERVCSQPSLERRRCVRTAKTIRLTSLLLRTSCARSRSDRQSRELATGVRLIPLSSES